MLFLCCAWYFHNRNNDEKPHKFYSFHHFRENSTYYEVIMTSSDKNLYVFIYISWPYSFPNLMCKFEIVDQQFIFLPKAGLNARTPFSIDIVHRHWIGKTMISNIHEKASFPQYTKIIPMIKKWILKVTIPVKAQLTWRVLWSLAIVTSSLLL